MINKVNLGKVYHWNPWLGCRKVSEACENCYIKHMNDFVLYHVDRLPFKCQDVAFVICSLQTDFFLEEADLYREQAWDVIRNNPNLIFVLITKRVERIKSCLPDDWDDGWDNVVITVTAENQQRADERLPQLLSLPVKHKWVTCSPLLEQVDLSTYLDSGQIEHVECCGETGDPDKVRPLQYEWVANLSQQCKLANVRFSFMKVGHKFIYNGEVYREYVTCYHSPIADGLGLCNDVPLRFNTIQTN